MNKLFILLAFTLGLALGVFIGERGEFLSHEPDIKIESNNEKSEPDVQTPEVLKTEVQTQNTVVTDEPNVFKSKLFSLRHPSGWRQTDSVGLAQLLIDGLVDELLDPRGIYFVSPDASYANQKNNEITKGNVLAVYYNFASTQGLNYYDLTVMRSADAKYKNTNRYETIVVDGHNIVMTNDLGYDDRPNSPNSITAYTVDDEFEYNFVFDTTNKKDSKEWELFKSILQTVRFK